jgi:hypothetical protein
MLIGNKTLLGFGSRFEIDCGSGNFGNVSTISRKTAEVLRGKNHLTLSLLAVKKPFQQEISHIYIKVVQETDFLHRCLKLCLVAEMCPFENVYYFGDNTLILRRQL